MQKIRFFLSMLVIILIASCASAGEKATGSYSGYYKELDSTYQMNGVVNFNKTTGNRVNMSLQMPLNVLYMVDEVIVALDGDNVVFVYDVNPTANDQIISMSGTLIGTTLNLSLVIYNTSGNSFGTFIGTKN